MLGNSELGEDEVILIVKAIHRDFTSNVKSLFYKNNKVYGQYSPVIAEGFTIEIVGGISKIDKGKLNHQNFRQCFIQENMIGTKKAGSILSVW